MTELIAIENVKRNDEKGAQILKGISAKVLDGEFITMIGPSGSGKSTLLSLLNRMIDPDEGMILYKETPFFEIDVLQLRRKIGMVFQLPTMIKGSVRDNIVLGPSLYHETMSEKEVENLLTRVGLPRTYMDKEALTLSGGEKQKVSLARTLANHPEVLLLDEVTASLDPESTAEIEKLIKNLHDESKKTILWVTHNIAQARKMGQYTWVLKAGALIEQGVTEELFNHPKHDFTKKFIQIKLDSHL